MKKNNYLLLVLLSFSVATFAQYEQKTIVQDLNTTKQGQGNVKIYQDASIEGLVAIRQVATRDSLDTDNASSTTTNTYNKTRGYKIQIFAGNNQKQSKNEGESKKAQIQRAFPELSSELKFNSPFWRLRVGNFATREDAEKMLKEIKKTFPSFKEMKVVDPSR